jgi:hypothetical protein
MSVQYKTEFIQDMGRGVKRVLEAEKGKGKGKGMGRKKAREQERARRGQAAPFIVGQAYLAVAR